VAGPAYGAAKMVPGLGRVLAEEAQKMPMRLMDETGAVGKPGLTPKVIPNESGFGSKVEYLKDDKTVGSGQLRGDEITNVVVPEEFRRQGYGTEIMKDLMDRGGKKGYPATEAGKKLMQKVGLADETGAIGKVTKPKINTLERRLFDIGKGKMEDGYYVTVPPEAKGEGWIVEGPFIKKTAIEFLENEVGVPTGRIVQVRKGALAVPQKNPELDMFRGVDADLDSYRPISPLSSIEDYRPKTVTEWSKK
jgi:hypothetical protein